MLLSKFSSTFFNLVYRLIYYLDVIIRFDLLMCVLNVLNKAHIVGAFGFYAIWAYMSAKPIEFI